MASVNDGMWMENLEEYVFEEKKAVTYKWLSRTLKVHVNVAKQMLFEFAQKNKAKVSCVYLLAGTKSNNDFLVKLTKEENLEKCESLFSKLTSKHVHTVAASQGVDYILSQINLLSVDMAVRKEGKPTTAFSGIINKSGVPRSERVAEEVPLKQIDVKKEPIDPPPKQNHKSAIEGVLDKQNEKGDGKSSNTSHIPSKPATAKKMGGIAGLFAKQAATSVTKKPPPEPVSKVESPEVSPGKENLSNHLKEKEEEKKIKIGSEKGVPQKKRGSSHAFEKPSKRRKRIQVLSDSDSSDREDSSREDDPVSPPPPQATKIESDDDDEVIPSTPVEKAGQPQRRVRKVVKKTYLGEDGFMVTKMEMESCSEDEAPVVEQPRTKLTPAKAKATSSEKNVKPSSASSSSSSGGKSKQASIMNFFQKK